jgi:hypothetical protein
MLVVLINRATQGKKLDILKINLINYGSYHRKSYFVGARKIQYISKL